MLRHRNLPALATLVCLAVASCGGGGTAPPATIAPTSSPEPVPTLAATTVTVATSVVATDPPTTLPDAIGLSPGGPWTRVDSAPGVSTPGLFYELMPELWVYLPVEEDIAHGITWTFTEADRPVIEAYLQARLVYFRAVTSDPIDLGLDGWTQWYADGGAVYFDSLTARRAQGQTADLDVGVVLRPEVIGDERTDTEAIVFDCVLDGGVFRMADGSLAPGSTPGVLADGVGFRISETSGRWRVTQVGSQPDACQ